MSTATNQVDQMSMMMLAGSDLKVMPAMHATQEEKKTDEAF